jgi:hypothetical protein
LRCERDRDRNGRRNRRKSNKHTCDPSISLATSAKILVYDTEPIAAACLC